MLVRDLPRRGLVLVLVLVRLFWVQREELVHVVVWEHHHAGVPFWELALRSFLRRGELGRDGVQRRGQLVNNLAASSAEAWQHRILWEGDVRFSSSFLNSLQVGANLFLDLGSIAERFIVEKAVQTVVGALVTVRCFFWLGELVIFENQRLSKIDLFRQDIPRL